MFYFTWPYVYYNFFQFTCSFSKNQESFITFFYYSNLEFQNMINKVNLVKTHL